MTDKTPARLEWDRMDDNGKAQLLIASVFAAMRTWRSKGWTMGHAVQNLDDAQTVAGEAFPILVGALDKSGDPLQVLAYRAVTSAAQRLQRQQMRWNANTAPAGIEDENGNVIELWDAVASVSTTAPKTAALDGALAVRDALDRVIKDDLDREIMALLEAGYTVRQIADVTGTSKSTVQRRIDGIRDRAGDPAELFAMLA